MLQSWIAPADRVVFQTRKTQAEEKRISGGRGQGRGVSSESSERSWIALAWVSLEDPGEESSHAIEETGMLGFLLRLRRRGWLNDRIEVDLALRGLVEREIWRGLRGSRRRFRGTIFCSEYKGSVDLNVNVVRIRCRKRSCLRTIRQLRASGAGTCAAARHWIAA